MDELFFLTRTIVAPETGLLFEEEILPEKLTCANKLLVTKNSKTQIEYLIPII